MFKKRRMGERGMTLIEILIVLGIIGVLMGSVLLGIKTAVNRSRRTTAKNQIKQIEAALITYENDEGDFPDSLDALVTEEYIPEKLLKDPWKRDYQFTKGGGGDCEYEIKSSGRDEGDAKDDITSCEKEE